MSYSEGRAGRSARSWDAYVRKQSQTRSGGRRALIATAGLAQFANLFHGVIHLHLENAFAEQRRGFRRVPDVALAIA